MAGIGGSSSEMLEVTRCAGGVILVVPRRGTGARLVAAPGFVITLAEIFIAAIGVRQVSYGQNCSRHDVQQFGAGFRAGEICAINDIAGGEYGVTFLFRIGSR